MCKILTFTNSKKLDLKKTVNAGGKILMRLEKDGFGYAVDGMKGVFGEKCIDSTFESRIDTKNLNPIDVIKTEYSQFGVKSKNKGAMILHGRTSTNEIGLENCHPMIKDDNYLIHNGVVSDLGPDYDMLTTNDSEHVLTRFLEGIDSIEKNLSGYYAFSCIDSKGQLHIVRDDNAELYISWIESMDTFVIATTEAIIEDVCGELDIDHGPIDMIKDNVYMIFSGNKIVHNEKIFPLGWTSWESSYAEKSLGKAIDNDKPMHWKEDDFLDAVQFVDDTCEIMNKDDRTISATEFHVLPLSEQKNCYILFRNGEEVDYYSKVA